MRYSTSILLTVSLFAGCERAASPASQPAPPQPQALATVDLPLGNRTFTLQVADNIARRETGLMYVRSMPPGHGMIFVFPTERVQEFWMHNTPIDLDIVYVDHTGKIVAVKTMHAYDESSVSSDEPANIAIEMNAGEAKEAGLAASGKVTIPTDLLAKAR